VRSSILPRFKSLYIYHLIHLAFQFRVSKKATRFCWNLQDDLIFNKICSKVKLGNKELFGQPKIVPILPNVPYPYEVNGKLVKGNGSLTTICFLSNRSLSPNLTEKFKSSWRFLQIFVAFLQNLNFCSLRCIVKKLKNTKKNKMSSSNKQQSYLSRIY
jgi:hypothetical protein